MNELDSALIALGEQCKDLQKSVEDVRLMLAGLRMEEPEASAAEKTTVEEKPKRAAKEPAAEPPATQKAPVTIDQVRAVMLAKRKAGYENQVKSLLIKRGKKTLSDIDPGEYESLLAEAEAIGT